MNPHDPHPGYSDASRLCAYYNRNMREPGLLWMVGGDGRPFLTDDEAVTAERHRKDKAAKDEEARRHNHRLMHPIDETNPEGE